jgi:hypothetical protein
MKIFVAMLISLALSGCTINFSVVHTQGYASDVVDDTTEEEVNPKLSLPLKGI